MTLDYYIFLIESIQQSTGYETVKPFYTVLYYTFMIKKDYLLFCKIYMPSEHIDSDMNRHNKAGRLYMKSRSN